MANPEICCRRTPKRGTSSRRFLTSSMSPLLAIFCSLFGLNYLHLIEERCGIVNAYNVVRVCRNKHCCKRTKVDVLQTIYNLIDTNSDIVVEQSGCLSNCDKGPNVEVNTKSGTVLLNGMTDAQTCAFQLGELSSSTPSFPPIPKILIAASKVIEQSREFSASGQLEEEIRFLTSVIDKLEVSPAVPPLTSANADAHAFRAQAHLRLAREQKERIPSDPNKKFPEGDALAASIHDAQRVVRDLTAVATPASLSLAYRTWTDAELFLAEQREQQQREIEKGTTKKKDFSRVVAVLTEWYRAQPMYRTKLQGEIQGLLLNM